MAISTGYRSLLYSMIILLSCNSIICTDLKSRREIITTDNWKHLLGKQSSSQYLTNNNEGSGDFVNHHDDKYEDLLEASGFGPDDEDGDVLEGSGAHDPFTSRTHTSLDHQSNVIEGSGPDSYWPEVPKMPAMTTTTTVTWIDHDHIDIDDSRPPDDQDIRIDEHPTWTDGPPTEYEHPPTSIYDTERRRTLDPFLRPGILAAVIGGAVVGLLAAILLVMFIVYRMRKKDEGSYALDEPKQPPHYSYAYQKAPTKEFYA